MSSFTVSGAPTDAIRRYNGAMNEASQEPARLNQAARNWAVSGKALLELMREFATISGLLAGAYWAVFEFNALHRVAKADAELSELRQKIEHAEEDHKRAQLAWDLRRPALELTISEVVVHSGTPKQLVSPTVTITNKGLVDVSLDLRSARFVAARLEIEDNVARESVSERHQTAIDADASILRAGLAQQFPFTLQLQPGIYLLEFRVAASVQDSAELQNLFGIQTDGPLWWKARRHVQVN